MIVQIKTGDSQGIQAMQVAILQQGGGVSSYYQIAPQSAHDFNSYDVPTDFGVYDARGIRFLIKGPVGSSWEISFVNITDGSTGIWRWEPHIKIPINQFPNLWHMYDVGERLVGGSVPPETTPCGYWVDTGNHAEYCH